MERESKSNLRCRRRSPGASKALRQHRAAGLACWPASAVGRRSQPLLQEAGRAEGGQVLCDALTEEGTGVRSESGTGKTPPHKVVNPAQAGRTLEFSVRDCSRPRPCLVWVGHVGTHAGAFPNSCTEMWFSKENLAELL